MASAADVILVDAAPDAGEWVEARLRQLEARWSRFVETSDITAINQHPDEWIVVSSDTIRLLQTMQLASRATNGGYDPTFLHQLLSVGYSASIDDPERITIAVDTPCRDHDVHDVRIDVATSSVFAPRGLSIDPGGIGKGFAGDLVVTELLAAGTGGALVSVGGDIAAAGVAPTEHGWHVHVEHPTRAPATVTTLAVSDGGIATSSTRSRRWLHSGEEQHHIIDPATGKRSRTDLATATVVANAGWLAEAHAGAALLQGTAGAIAYMDARCLTGIVVDVAGAVSATADIAAGIDTGAAS